MRAEGLDTSPRRIWTGVTVPGKKMMAMLTPDAGIKRGRSLIDLYGDVPYMALLTAAIALHSLSTKGAFGPAFRDLRKPLQSLMLYGAMLTDIRDFLKLRFRAKGLTGTEAVPFTAIAEGIRAGDLRECLENITTEGDGIRVTSYVVNYVITELDSLSRNTTISSEDFEANTRRLRDILRSMVRWVYPEWYGGREHYDRYIDTLFEEPTG